MSMVPIFKCVSSKHKDTQIQRILIGFLVKKCQDRRVGYFCCLFVCFSVPAAKRQERRSCRILKHQLIRINTTLSFCSLCFFERLYEKPHSQRFFFFFFCRRGSFLKTPVQREGQIDTWMCNTEHVKNDLWKWACLKQILSALNCETSWSLLTRLCFFLHGWSVFLDVFPGTAGVQQHQRAVEGREGQGAVESWCQACVR